MGRSDPAVVTLGSGFSRLSILLLYFVAARALKRPDYAFLAYIVGVSAFLQIVFDPSSVAAFVVAEGTSDGHHVARHLIRTGVRLMRVAGVAVIAAPTLIGAIVSGNSTDLAVSVSVGLIASGESIVRFARTGWQIEHKFRQYAGVDILLGLGRIVTTVAMALSHSLLVFAVTNVVIGLAWQTLPRLGGVMHYSPASLVPHAPGSSLIKMARRVWPYSASYLAASIYSNGPAVLVGLFGGVAQGALYSIVSRLTQPTELVPQALSAVNLPRLTKADDSARPVVFRRQAIQAGLAGAAVAIALVLAAPLSLDLFRLSFGQAFPLLVVLAAILPLKFLSYQFVALLMAEGNVRSRLRAGAAVATLSIVGVCAVAWDGALAAAVVTLACECLLVTLLYHASRTTAHAALFGDHGGDYGSIVS